MRRIVEGQPATADGETPADGRRRPLVPTLPARDRGSREGRR